MAIALFALLVAQQASLTLSVPAARLPVLLSEISAKTGLALEAGPAMRQEVVCLFVKDAPVATVLAKLAEVTGGEWRESGGVKRLFPSTAVERREKAERETKVTEGARAALKAEHVKIDRARTLDEKTIRSLVELSQKAMLLPGGLHGDGDPALTKEIEAKDPGAPSERLLVRLLDLVPFSEWTSLPSGARVVYSLNPTEMQRALPVVAAEEIRRFAAERQIWMRLMGPVYAKAMEAFARDLEKGGEESDLPSRVPTQLPERFKINLVIQLDAYGGGATASLSVRDLMGEEVDTASLNLNVRSGEDEDTEESKEPAPHPGDLLSLSPETLDFAKLVGTSRVVSATEANLESRINRWRPFALDPVGNEPMAPFAQLWIEMAKAKNVNLVGYVDDFLSQGNPRKPIGADELLANLSEANTVVNGDGWLTIRPRAFSEVRKYRVDRELASRLYPLALRANGLTIDHAADYAAASGSPLALAASVWDGGYLSFLLWANGIPRPRLFMSSALQIYGMLGPKERQTIHSRALRFSELPARAQELLAHNLYWPEESEEAVIGSGEPTDQFPHGLPPSGLIKISAEGTEQVVVPMIQVGSREVPATTGRNAVQFGKVLAGVSGSETQRKAALTFQGYRRFRVATGHWIDIEIAYSPAVKTTERLYELICPPGPIIAYEDLPSTFKTAVEAARQKALAELQARPPISTAPPPP